MGNPLFVGLGILFLSIGIISFIIFPDAHVVTRTFALVFSLIGVVALYIGIKDTDRPSY